MTNGTKNLHRMVSGGGMYDAGNTAASLCICSISANMLDRLISSSDNTPTGTVSASLAVPWRSLPYQAQDEVAVRAFRRIA